MDSTGPGSAGEAVTGPAQRRSPVAVAWRWLLPKPTVRLRLTVLYGALFLAAGALLLLLSFVLFRRGLDNALQPPLPHGHPRPSPTLASPFPPSPCRTQEQRRGSAGCPRSFPPVPSLRCATRPSTSFSFSPASPWR